MPIAAYRVAASDLSAAEIDRWRAMPVAVAVDLGSTIGQIDPAIRPLLPPGRQPRLFGRAVTVACEPPDFGAVPLAIDRIGAGEVLVIAAGGHAETAMIGEILGAHLRRRGAVGLVCDGAIRDVGTLASWTDFPVFTRHVTPRGPTSAERGIINGPIVVGGQLVRPGDLVIGDDDGLVAIAPEAIRDRIGEAEAKLQREAGWQESLLAGRSMAQTFDLADPLPLT
jgi:regulator of RNase E activity RraA